MLRFAVFIIYLATSLLECEGMTVIKSHGNMNRGGKVLRTDAVRKIYFDPAPPVDLRRRRRTLNKNVKITPISNAAIAAKAASQKQHEDKAAREALADFLKKNGLKLSAIATAAAPTPPPRLEQTVKPLLPASLVEKRQNIAYNLEMPDFRSSASPKEALSYDVVENLVLAIKKNNNLDIEFITKDLKRKLDMVLEKNVPPGLRGNDATTKPSKPKKQNLIKEMDKIMDSFLRTAVNTSSESSSVEKELPAPPKPIMRSEVQGAERLRDDEEEDLEFDLDGEDGGDRDKLKFTLKDK